ncbi:MAG: LysM peptidoglycan-binding domain-containing protein [Elusimicrobiota bacterium]
MNMYNAIKQLRNSVERIANRLAVGLLSTIHYPLSAIRCLLFATSYFLLAVCYSLLPTPYTLHPTPCLYADFELVGRGVGTARAFALNNAFTAIADDTNAIFYNPAGLVQNPTGRFSCGYRKLFWNLTDDSNLTDGTLGITHPLDKNSALGIGWYSFSLQNSYSENVWAVSYGTNLTQWLALFSENNPFSVGLTAKLLSKKYGNDIYTATDSLFLENNYSKLGFSCDLGLLYILEDNYSFGLVVIDMNQPDMNLNDKKMNIPAKYKLGFAYRTILLNFTTEIVSKKGEITSNTGIEKYLFDKHLTARVGIGVGSREYRAVSVGAGYQTSIVQIDYAFVYPLAGITDTLGTHSISISLPFWFATAKETQKKMGTEEMGTEEIKVEHKKLTTYTVQAGDTLPRIAAKPEIYGNPVLWRKIYEANKDKISPSYELTPGQLLTIPRD